MIDKFRLNKIIQNVEGQFYKDCLTYFTKEVNNEELNLYKKPDFRILFDSFNLSTIPGSEIINEADEIKKRPEISIPIILKFNKKIDPSYFSFLVQLSQPEISNLVTKENITEVYPHLFRFLVCANYQIENCFIPISKGLDTEEIPHIFSDAFLVCIRLILILSDPYVQSLTNVIKAILWKLVNNLNSILSSNPIDTFIEYLYALTSSLNAIVSNNILQQEDNNEFIGISLQILLSFIKYRKLNNKALVYLKYLSNTIEKIFIDNNNDISSVRKPLIDLIILYFSQINDYTFNDISKKVSFSLLKILEKVADNFEGDTKEMAVAISYYTEWITTNSIKVEKNLPESEIVESFTDTIIPSDFHINNAKTINKNAISNYSLSSAFGKDQEEENKKDYFDKFTLPITAIMKKNNTIFVDYYNTIFGFLKKNKNPAMQLFITNVLLLLEKNQFEIFLSSVNSNGWKCLFNDYSLCFNIVTKDFDFYRQLNISSFKLIEKAFSCEEANLTLLLTVIFQYIKPNFPLQVKEIASLIYTLSKKYPIHFYKTMDNIQTWPFLIQIDLIYMHKVINSNEENSDLIFIHTKIIASLIELSKYKEFNDTIFDNKICIEYLLALTLEKEAANLASSILRNVLKTTEKENPLNKCVEFLEIIVSRGVDYVNAFTHVTESFRSAIQNSNKFLIDYFDRKSLVEKFSKIVKKFSEYDIGKTLCFSIITTTLNLFLVFCQHSNTNIISFSKKQETFIESFSFAINKIDMNEALADILISLCLNEITSFQTETHPRTLRNTPALWLLYNTSKNCALSNRIFAYLLAIISSSVENCWHCYISGFLLHLINDISDSTPHIIFELINAIGSRFFGLAELNTVFQQLKKINLQLSWQLVETVYNMFKTRITFPLSTGFYVENETKRYFTPSFSKIKQFQLSFDCNIKKYVSIPILKIYSPKESITFSVGQQLSIIFKQDSSVQERIFTSQNKLKLESTNTIVFKMINDEIIINVNDVLVEKIQNYRFSFQSDPISFELLDREKLQSVCENLKITKIKTADSKAIIFDHSVPFPLPFSSVLPLAGGPQIFLPFLEMVEKSVHPKKVFLKYLQIIGLAINDEETQVNPSFFRAMGHLLKQIPIDIWTDSAVNEIHLIALRLRQPRLVIAMLQHILLDFQFWDKFEKPVKVTILDKTIVTIKNEMCDIFISSIDFDMLLIRIYRVFSKGQNNCFCQTFIDILNSYKAISINSVLALISLGLKPGVFQDIALNVLFSHLESNYETVITLLERYEYYKPFIELSLVDNEKIRFWSMNIIFYLFKNIPIENIPKFSQHITTLGRKFTKNIPIEPFLDLSLGFITDEIQFINNTIPTSNLQACYDYTIKYSEFFPLFICFSLLATNKSNSYTDIILSSLRNSKESRNNIKKINNWMFWLMTFFALFSTADEFGGILALFAIDDENQDLNYYYLFLILACTKLNWNWEITAGSFIIELLNKMPSFEVYKIAIFFICISQKFTDKNTIDFTSKNLDINGVMDAFYNPLLSSITFLSKPESSFYETQQAQFIFNIISYKVIDNLSLLSTNIKISNNIFISFSDVLVYLLDIYRSVEKAKSNEIIKTFTYSLSSIKDTDQSLVTFCLYLMTLDFNKKSKLVSYLVRAGIPKDQIEEKAAATRAKVRKTIEDTIPCINVLLTSLFNEIVQNGLMNSTREHFITKTQDLIDESHAIFIELSKQEDTREDQIKRQNAKVWNKVSKALKENGGAWSVVENEQHWKLDPKIDILGRHYRLKKNRHFDDHKDASKQRDSGIKAPPKSNAEPFKLFAPKDIELDSTPFFHSDCQMNTITCLYRGTIHLYKDIIVFESRETFDPCEDMTNKENRRFKNNVYEIEISDVKYVLNRRYMHKDLACEIFTKKMTSYFFIFPDNVRSNFYKRLAEKNIYVQTGPSSKVLKDFGVVKRWKKGLCSNFQYLYMINIICGRSYNDLNQYPVFPWVISNYKSKTIDLKDPNNYRDLSKPIGTYDKDRLNELIMGYNEMNDPTMKCMYRVFYSNPAQTIGFMVRVEPFTTMHIKLQSGQFDISGRLFQSISEAWESATHETGDYRELIPEFFSLPAFLENQNNFDLGVIKTTGERVNDVILPPWADSAASFIHINRMALESPYVSATLNQWVDLIFGYKQRGIEAEKALNVFHPFSYPSIMEQEDIMEVFGPAIASHSLNFGVTPSIAFSEPSPIRGNFTTAHTFDVLFSPKYFESNDISTSVIIYEKDIITTSNDGRVVFSNFMKNEIKMKREVQFPSKFISCFNATSELSKRFIIIDSQFVVLASSTENSFTLFDIKSDNAKIIAESQKQPGTITALAADINKGKGTIELFVASAATDSSIFVYNYILSDKLLQCSRTSLLAHESSIIDVDLSYTYDLIASIDKTTLAFTSISSGKLIISQTLERRPSKVMITENGYVIVVSILKENNQVTTEIVLYNSMGGKINSKVRLGECTALTLYTDPNQEEFAIFCFSDNTFSVMSIFDLVNVVQGELDRNVVSVASSRKLDCVIVCQDDGMLKVQPFNKKQFEQIISSK